MEKKTFKEELEKRISILTPTERQQILTFYEETIEDSIEDGMSEEEAVAKLGDMDMIVKDILAENHIALPERKESIFGGMDKKWKYLLLFLTSPLWASVSCAVLALVLCVYLFIGCGFLLLACVGIMPFLCIIGAILVVPFQLFQNLPYSLLVSGMAFLCGGLAILVYLNFKTWWSWVYERSCMWTRLVMTSISTICEKVVL